MKQLAACALWLLSAVALADPIPFQTYLKLHNGMLEAELIAQAGKPDYSSDQPQSATQGGVATVSSTRQLAWLANSQLPYTTIVTVRDGVVVNIVRDKKL